ncbi:MAG: tRNA uridine-5-carboxymethylaminomethyl(34) synthesis GTPase MnmE [Elusimicrobia bacterium RIFOXYA2_FULL_58_8]|nr:MAG: tRNA uridine-5-carboxymethylaminomethyl(34) synthesis GTPase MnmE [Elusimicrobia bacterium RIFOXYA2_FULL_58_8]OGS14317.1 MAG: tRNA uridine-5-carboxymethylaminomethyl(34) synthesis GTPase MnmE [Elusimicrobia bacterium RIFOXYA12_FULL_57_11]
MHLPDTERTIVALATPPGAAALAIIRLSGPAAFSTAAKFMGPPLTTPAHRLARLLDIRDGSRLIDRAVTVFFKAPASYTGQDTVEITCHGSPYITRTILNLAIRSGASLAAPGEFTLRAFINGKLDLAQAEAVGSLVAAGSEAAHRAALAQVQGEMSRKIRALKQAALHLLAGVEARLDDSHEEITPVKLSAFLRESGKLKKETLDLAAGFEAGRGIREGIRVVITGAPNSGKSSLLNSLLGYDRAIVSTSAGTTRDTLEAKLEIGGFTVIFTDTAGLNAAARHPLETEGIRRAITAISQADIILLLKDCSTPRTASDTLAQRRAGELAAPGAALIKVITKTDLPAKTRAAGGIKTSCRNGTGLDALRRALVARQKKAFRDGAQAPVIFARHFEALRAAAGELGKLQALMKQRTPPLELAAEHLRGTLNALGTILGETAPEEILSDIFKNFCVGK